MSSITINKSVTNQFMDFCERKFKDKSYEGSRKAALLVPVILIALVETVARAIFAIISPIGFGIGGICYLANKDKSVIDFFKRNFVALCCCANELVLAPFVIFILPFTSDEAFKQKRIKRSG